MPEGNLMPSGVQPHPPNATAELWIKRLERHYAIQERSALSSLLREQGQLPGLLMEAVPYLPKWFGDRPLHLRVSYAEEEIALRASVVWPSALEPAEEALRAFDADWWLANCAKSDGYLVFDFELVDGV
jgi:hypothetical protein